MYLTPSTLVRYKQPFPPLALPHLIVLANNFPAFRIRAQLHLVFISLSRPSRLLLWYNFVNRLDAPSRLGSWKRAMDSNKLQISEKDMYELAEWKLNDRDVNNFVRTVSTWSLCKDFEMNLGRLKSGIKVTAP